MRIVKNIALLILFATLQQCKTLDSHSKSTSFTVPYLETSDDESPEAADQEKTCIVEPIIYTCNVHKKNIQITFTRHKTSKIWQVKNELFLDFTIPQIPLSANDIKQSKFALYAKCTSKSQDCCVSKGYICSLCPGTTLQAQEFKNLPTCREYCSHHKGDCDGDTILQPKLLSSKEEILLNRQERFKNIAAKTARNLLHIAVLRNDIDAIKELRHTGLLFQKDNTGCTPFDLATKHNRRDIIQYLIPFVIKSTLSSPEKQTNLQVAILEFLNQKDTQRYFAELFEHIGIQLPDYKAFSEDLVLNMITSLTNPDKESESLVPTIVTSAPKPELKNVIDNFLQDVKEGISKHYNTTKCPDENLKNFDIESLRPSTEMFVEIVELLKEIKEKEKEKLREVHDNEILLSDYKKIRDAEKINSSLIKVIKETAIMPISKCNPQPLPYIKKEEMIPARPIPGDYFIPEIRIGNANKIKVDAEYLIEDIEYLKEQPIPDEMYKDVTNLLEYINIQSKEIRLFYRSLKKASANLDPRYLQEVVDKIYIVEQKLLAPDLTISEKNDAKKKKERLIFEKTELEHITRRPQIAKELLVQMSSYKSKLINLMHSKSINKKIDLPLSIIENLYYDSDPENDYSVEELEDYLKKYIILNTNDTINHTLSQINTYLSSTIYDMINIITKKDHLSYEIIHNIFFGLSSSLRFFINKIYSPHKIIDMHDVKNMTSMILHILVLKISKPYSKTFEIQNLNHIVKNFFKLERGLKKAISENC